MLFAIYCVDRPGCFPLRQATRPGHLEYLAGFRDRIVMAGPMLDEQGEISVGGIMIVDFPDRASAEAFARNDPYSVAGLFESVVVRRWRQVIPQA